MRIGVKGFRGEAPRLAPQELPPGGAQRAINCRLQSGDLEAWRQFTVTQGLSIEPQTIYLLKDQWLAWGSDVDVARSLIPGDQSYRIYLTGPDEYDGPRWTNYALAFPSASDAPAVTRPIGVPASDTAPTLVVGVATDTSTFSIDTTDAGNALADWTTSPDRDGSGTFGRVLADAALGNPLPSYQLVYDENRDPGTEVFAYKSFGIAGATVTKVSADVYFSDDLGVRQAALQVACNVAGSGIRAVYVNGQLSIQKASQWGAQFYSATLTTQTITPALSGTTWYRLEVTATVNDNGTKTVKAEIFNGPTSLGSCTATNNFDDGDYVGICNGIGSDAATRYRTNYDNIRAQASGSTGTTVINVATSYVFTMVNDLGEESAPSPASATILRPDGVSVTVTTPVASPSGYASDYGITTKRIYRAVTGATGSIFRFVTEIPLATADYVDTLTDAQLGEALESEGWDLPPAGLRGILALPNGIMVGFVDNLLCLSAQNRPHAWPVGTRYPTDTAIVGIGAIDTAVVIGTKAHPYVAQGSTPEGYQLNKLEVPQSCVSKRSVAYLAGVGVCMAGPDGYMAIAGVAMPVNITRGIFTRKQWQALEPDSILATAHDDVLHFFVEKVLPPEDPSFDKVILLNLFDEDPPVDWSQYHKGMALTGDGSIETTTVAVGTGALARPDTNNSGARTSPGGVGYPSTHAFGSLNFTAEGWVMRTGVGLANPSFTIGDNLGNITLLVGSGLVLEDRMSAWVKFDGASWGLKLEAGPGSCPLNTWIAWCVMRIGNTIYFFLDGVLKASGAFSGNIEPSGFEFTTSYVSYGGGGPSYKGLYDQTRLTRDAARYPTSGYTVSLDPFPVTGPTSGAPGGEAEFSKGYALDTKPDGFGLIELGYHASAVHSDPISDHLYLALDALDEPTADNLPVPSGFSLASGPSIYQFDADETALMTYRWRGKLNLVPAPYAPSYARVEGEDFDNVVMRGYQDGLSQFDVVVDDAVEFRLPTPRTAKRTYELELIGTSRMRNMQVAEDIGEIE